MLSLILVSSLTAAACGGGDSGASSKDTLTVPDTGGGDADAVDPPDTTEPDDTAEPGDGADSVDPGDVADSVDPGDGVDSVDPGDGTEAADGDTSGGTTPLGGVCADNAECASGLCLGETTRVCVEACVAGACEGAERYCQTLVLDSVPVDICVGRDEIAGQLCDPEGEACLGGATCTTLGDGVSRCVFACDNGTCDPGYTCNAGLDVCIPPGGFDCSLFDAASGLVGRCQNDNALGSCQGEYVCNGAGAGQCAAATPIAETCDLLDNDCDGTADDGLCDDGNACTDDACAAAGDGTCTHVARTGLSCEDGNACTANDACTATGECTGENVCECTTVADCPIPGSQHEDCVSVACQGTPLKCVYTAINAGGTCEKDRACLTDGTCNAAGQCLGQTSTCDDQKSCTADSCGEDGQCLYEAFPIGTTCNDGNACTTGDKCVAGSLCIGDNSLPCDDENPCTDNSCDPLTGCVITPNTAACSDGNDCTQADACVDGQCQGTLVDCATLTNQCNVGQCSPTGCVAVPKEGSCDDGDACTLGDTCQAGVCKGVPKDCHALDIPCAEATCYLGVCVAPTATCSFIMRAHLVSAAFNATPTNGAHWFQGSVGHGGPVGPAKNPLGFAAYFGFHAVRMSTP